jgi:hypothetical protein
LFVATANRKKIVWWFLIVVASAAIVGWIGIAVYMGFQLAFVWELVPMYFLKTWTFFLLLACLSPKATRRYFGILRDE